MQPPPQHDGPIHRKITWRQVGLIALGVTALLCGTCAYLVSRINLGDCKGEHRLPVAGNARLTDEQAVSLARQVLVLDSRDVPNLALVGPEYGDPATREPDGSVQVAYQHKKTKWIWYVRLRREDGRVVGKSCHGT